MYKEVLQTDPLPMDRDHHLRTFIFTKPLCYVRVTYIQLHGLGLRVSQVTGLSVVKPGPSVANWPELVTSQCFLILWMMAFSPLLFFPHQFNQYFFTGTLDSSGELWKLEIPRPHLRCTVLQALAIRPRLRAFELRITAWSRHQISCVWGCGG